MRAIGVMVGSVLRTCEINKLVIEDNNNYYLSGESIINVSDSEIRKYEKEYFRRFTRPVEIDYNSIQGLCIRHDMLGYYKELVRNKSFMNGGIQAVVKGVVIRSWIDERDNLIANLNDSLDELYKVMQQMSSFHGIEKCARLGILLSRYNEELSNSFTTKYYNAMEEQNRMMEAIDFVKNNS